MLDGRSQGRIARQPEFEDATGRLGEGDSLYGTV
jgi:hypothetical protein